MLNHRLQHVGIYALGMRIVLTPAFSPRPATAAGSELVLAVQPILGDGLTHKAFQFRQAGCS